MKPEDITTLAHENLCWYDTRSPFHIYQEMNAEDMVSVPEPRTKGCGCDPCFQGRDKLAMALLLLLEEAPRYYLMSDGSSFIVSREERSATGAEHLRIIFDSKRTRKTMFVKPGSDNAITLHSITEP